MILRLLMLFLLLNILQVQSEFNFQLSSQLTGSNKHETPIIGVKVSSDQTRLFTWQLGGNLRIWLKDNDKLTYKGTINFEGIIPYSDIYPRVKNIDFIYITDDSQRIYLPNQENHIQIYQYQGADNDPVYRRAFTITIPDSTQQIFSIVVNQQRKIIFLGSWDKIYCLTISDGEILQQISQKTIPGFYANNLKLIDNQQRLLANLYLVPAPARLLSEQFVPPKMVLYDIVYICSLGLTQVTDISIMPTQVQNIGLESPFVNIWKFRNTLYIFSQGFYQEVKQFTLMAQDDPLEQLWTLQPNVQSIIVHGVVNYNSQYYSANYHFMNFRDRTTLQQLLDQLKRLMGNNLPTFFRGLEDNNFLIGSSDGGLYSNFQGQDTSIPAHCKSYTVLSSGAVRCDICQSQYVTVVINDDDNRVCCERIQFCSQYNRTNCLCNTCFGDYLNVDKKICREINSDQKCKEYDFTKNICSKCDIGYTQDKHGICTIIQECQKGWYKNSSGICNPGNKPYCQEYESPTGDCTKCYQDYRFNEEANCVQIPDINKNIKCPENTPQTVFYKQNGKCKFKGVSCKQANEDGSCKYCISDSFYLYKSVCIPVFYPVKPQQVNIRRDEV